MSDERPPWQVLLIGGSSGAGKTELARALARHYGVASLQADDLRIAAQQIALAPQHPALHRFWTDAGVYEDADAYRDGLIAVAAIMEPAIAAVMAHHLAVRPDNAIIVEGDSILPRLAVAERVFRLWQDNAPVAPAAFAADVRALFLHEPDADGVFRAMRGRGRGFDQHDADQQHPVVRGSWLYGEWLRTEAERHGLPVIAPRPYDTLLARALHAIGPHAS